MRLKRFTGSNRRAFRNPFCQPDSSALALFAPRNKQQIQSGLLKIALIPLPAIHG
jgi:hypothetical protein